MEMTVDLFDSIINTSQDCVFWKDKERRFLGVNQAFLDFYGFESVDVILGKTDEEVGWHSDPEPYKQDELRVLAGKSTYKVQGRCIAKGQERDIIASKRPLYDGDEIVGLVGSFVDITDVIRRKNKDDGSQVLYTLEDLRKYRFFDKIIDEISLEEILDPLTGILSRAYAIKFVESLIADQTPFTFTIIDLDNFKIINDGYGHIAGDRVLEAVAKGLAEYSKDFGLAGRFGGDELLFIDLKNLKVPEKQAFFEGLYQSGALRRSVEFENGAAFVTGTSGCASFPKDAEDFTHLFSLIDKMLYLGKNKGRNCFTVYDEAKHKDIEIRKIAGNGIFTNMRRLREDMEEEQGLVSKLQKVMPRLSEVLQIKDLYYVASDGIMRAVLNSDYREEVPDLGCLMADDLFCESTLDTILQEAPYFYETLTQNGFQSVMISRIRKGSEVKGYLVCAVKRSMRIWQENECAILYYLSELLSEEF